MPNALKVIVVSGLPRSGTSLVMQMLLAGGVDLLVDQLRPTDQNNPRGYLEYEPAKSIAADNSWMHLALGKAIKIVAPLVPFLPNTFDYDIVFVRRDMREILASQRTMLGLSRCETPSELGEAHSETELSRAMQAFFDRAVGYSMHQPNIRFEIIDHRELLANPKEGAEKIAAFLGRELNLDAMAQQVDVSLYRNRAEQNTEKA